MGSEISNPQFIASAAETEIGPVDFDYHPVCFKEGLVVAADVMVDSLHQY